MSIPNISSDSLRLLGIKPNDKPLSISFPQPDFSKFDICTKTAPTMSDEKYKEAIIEQAKKDAANGNFGGENSKGYRDLKKSFVSVASPDRRSIITEASRKLLGKGKITFAEFKDGGGNVIAHYSQNNGWTSIVSPSETARESEFNSIYTEAWRAAYNNKGNATSTATTWNGDITGSSFNVSV